MLKPLAKAPKARSTMAIKPKGPPKPKGPTKPVKFVRPKRTGV